MHETVSGGVILAGTAIFVALITQWITRGAAEGSLGRTGVAGIRTKATTASDQAWQTGHRAALPVTGRLIHYALVGMVVTAALVWLAGDTPLPFVAGLASVGAQLALMFVAARRANDAAREAE